MLLRIIKANHFYNFILIPLLGLLMLWPALTGKHVMDTDTYAHVSPLFQPIISQGISNYAAVLINFAVVLMICFLLLQINARFSFVKERTFLPAFLFLVIVYALPELRIIQPVFFAGLFLILSIRSIFASFEKKEAIRNAFDAGFLIGLAGLFYFYATFFVILIPFSISILRNNLSWRDTFASFIGMLLPWLFFFSAYFIANNPMVPVNYVMDAFITKEKSFLVHLPIQIYLAYLMLIITICSVFILKQYGLKNISVRRYFKILFLFFMTSLLMLFIPYVSSEILVFLTIPLTFLITNYLIFIKRRIWAEFFLYLLVVIAALLQLFVNG
ncbi:MAG: hypothetical protein JXR22_04000 [Prolixibacteraceae bacterium]|nr:hypothetical protein [Prolixibacteraceae bacterium]